MFCLLTDGRFEVSRERRLPEQKKVVHDFSFLYLFIVAVAATLYSNIRMSIKGDNGSSGVGGAGGGRKGGRRFVSGSASW